MSTSPFPCADPLPVTFARELHAARGRGFVRPVTRLYRVDSHGSFALEAMERLVKREVEIATDAGIIEESILNSLRNDAHAAIALCRLGHTKEAHYG